MTGRLADAAWPEVGEGLVVVPLGSLEQHGPHLPLDTDTRIASHLAQRLVQVCGGDGSMLAPPIAYGASGEHEGFRGTVSIGAAAERAVLVEYGRSVCRWAPRVLFVNGHGGNASAVASAVTLLRYEGRDAAWWTPIVHGGDAHAGRTETAMLLHIAPESVRTRAVAPGHGGTMHELWDAVRQGGVAAVSESGVIGDPTGADAAEGERILDALHEELCTAVAQWNPDNIGRISGSPVGDGGVGEDGGTGEGGVPRPTGDAGDAGDAGDVRSSRAGG